MYKILDTNGHVQSVCARPFLSSKNNLGMRLYSIHVCSYNCAKTVQPRLSGTLIIRTSWRPENTLPHMSRRHDQWSLVGAVPG